MFVQSSQAAAGFRTSKEPWQLSRQPNPSESYDSDYIEPDPDPAYETIPAGTHELPRSPVRFRKLQSAETEHVLNSADCCVVLAQLSAVVYFKLMRTFSDVC